MGATIHITDLSDAQRRACGLPTIPTSKPRKARGKGDHAKRKAKRLAVMLEAATVKPVVSGGVLSVTIYMPLPNSLNASSPGNWWITSGARKDQRSIVASVLGRAKLPALPVSVKLTRISPKTVDAWDSLGASLKATVDAIAEECYGSKDNDPRFTWETPGQEKGKRVGVIIEIRTRSDL